VVAHGGNLRLVPLVRRQAVQGRFGSSDVATGRLRLRQGHGYPRVVRVRFAGFVQQHYGAGSIAGTQLLKGLRYLGVRVARDVPVEELPDRLFR
jgi:hypothetical protein